MMEGEGALEAIGAYPDLPSGAQFVEAGDSRIRLTEGAWSRPELGCESSARL